MIDAEGPARAYDPTTRAGRIIPVNADEFDVAWFTDRVLGVPWPDLLTRHDCRWPAVADPIVITSQLGSEGPSLDEATANDALSGSGLRVYAQPDPTRFGYNPNEEHAFLAPSKDWP